jgi:hypothetical protein
VNWHTRSPFLFSKDGYGIKGNPIKMGNHQANPMVERIRQVVESIIQKFELESSYINEDDPLESNN